MSFIFLFNKKTFLGDILSSNTGGMSSEDKVSEMINSIIYLLRVN